jgi:hypothetical protein
VVAEGSNVSSTVLASPLSPANQRQTIGVAQPGPDVREIMAARLFSCGGVVLATVPHCGAAHEHRDDG